MSKVDVTVIGGGPCGLFAAFYAGMRGMSVRIIDSLPELGGQLTALYPEKYIYDMPGFPKVLAKDLAKSMVEQASQYHPKLVLENTAQTLIDNGDSYTIVTDKGLEFETSTIIISAGPGAFQPTKIGVEREEHFIGRGIHYGVRDRSVFTSKRLAIVGGGDSAFDWCMDLEDIAENITLIHRRDIFKAHEDSVQKVKASSVNMKLFYVVKEIHGSDHLTGLTLESTVTKEQEHFACDEVCVNIGFKSSLGPLKDWGLNIEKNQIKVNERFETNIPRVFAVGDVASYDTKIKLIATGVGEASTAVCYAKTYLDPEAKLFPGHSSDRDH